MLHDSFRRVWYGASVQRSGLVWLTRRFLAIFTMIVLSLGLSLLISRYASVRAQSEDPKPFTVGMNVSYTVQPSGVTQVRYEVRLRNNVSTVYAKQYALQINSTDVENVRAVNAGGDNERVDVSQVGQSTTLTVQFDPNDVVVGRNQERLFTLEYTSKDAASIYGQVLEVSVPKLADPELYETYNVLVIVPDTFPEPSLVEPAQYTVDSSNGTRVLRFTDVGQQTGISVLFGHEQTYDMQLRYQVENTSQNIGVVQVALPPDTAFQRVRYRDITPQPASLHQDDDGNWIAEFHVAGQAKQTITALGQVTVYAKPTVPIPQDNPVRSSRKGADDLAVYLQSQTYWPVDHALIDEAIAQHKTPRTIYQYVVDTLQYNYKRAYEGTERATQRYGAVGALQNPNDAMCQEFTDVFVTLARAAGVPARRVTGYAMTQNSELRPLSLVSDVLHAWPEYYDAQNNLWVPIDPTWADTTGGVDYFSKLDLRHIVFARQGVHDERPYPAGLYKLAGSEEKDIMIELAGEKIDVSAPLDVAHESHFLPTWGLPARERFVIKNTSGEARYNVAIGIGVEGEVEVVSDSVLTIPVLLPYQEYELAVELSGPNWFQATPAKVRILIDANQESEYDVTARKAFHNPVVRWVVMGVGIALVSAGAGSVSVFGLRRLRFVRR